MKTRPLPTDILSLAPPDGSTLVVLAGGLGSRYGGLKQLDGVGPGGEIIMEYSIYDALRAGFSHVVIIVGQDTKDEFRSMLTSRLPEGLRVDVAVQDVHQLPAGYRLPEGRTKPWGTAHAVLAAKEFLSTPFAVINADDFYGRSGFATIADFLGTQPADDERSSYAMVGYEIQNTVTDHGTVSRGVCEVSAEGHLRSITERTGIARADEGAKYTLDEGQSWVPLASGTLVSMNLWGFTPTLVPALEEGFARFLDENLPTNPMKCEYFLPSVVQTMVDEGHAEVRVLSSPDTWYGVTYREDKPVVEAALARMHQEGIYPTPLWGQK